MSEKVPVFDPKSKDLRRLPLREINESDFDKVKVPGWQRRFDVYESPETDSLFSYTVVSRQTDEIEGRLLARLNFGKLGISSDVQRKLSSKHRWLYIGAMPDV